MTASCSRRASALGGPSVVDATQIHAVSVVDTAEVQQDDVARRQSALTGMRVGQRAVGSGRDDRIKRRALEAGGPQTGVDVRRHAALGPTGCHSRPDVRHERREQPGRRADRLDLEGVLDGTNLLHQAGGRHELRAVAAVGVYPRHPGRQHAECLNGEMRCLESQTASGLAGRRFGQRLLVRPFDEDQVGIRRPVL